MRKVSVQDLIELQDIIVILSLVIGYLRVGAGISLIWGVMLFFMGILALFLIIYEIKKEEGKWGVKMGLKGKIIGKNE